MWDRVLRAFDLFRKASAVKSLLELLGIWKYVALGGTVLIAACVAIWAYVWNLPPPVVVVLGLVALVALLFICGLGVAFWRVGGLEQPNTVEVGAGLGKRSPALVIAGACVILALGIIGVFASWRGVLSPSQIGSPLIKHQVSSSGIPTDAAATTTRKTTKRQEQTAVGQRPQVKPQEKSLPQPTVSASVPAPPEKRQLVAEREAPPKSSIGQRSSDGPIVPSSIPKAPNTSGAALQQPLQRVEKEDNAGTQGGSCQGYDPDKLFVSGSSLSYRVSDGERDLTTSLSSSSTADQMLNEFKSHRSVCKIGVSDALLLYWNDDTPASTFYPFYCISLNTVRIERDYQNGPFFVAIGGRRRLEFTSIAQAQNVIDALKKFSGFCTVDDMFGVGIGVFGTRTFVLTK